MYLRHKVISQKVWWEQVINTVGHGGHGHGWHGHEGHGGPPLVDMVAHVKSLSQTRPSVSRFGIFENILPIFCTDCCMFSNIRKNWLVSLKIIIYWLLHILSWQYFKNILTGLKDILADPLPTALHNFPIASSNISDNLETIWSDTEEDGFTKISLSHSKYCKLWKEKNIYVGKWYFGEYL